MEGDFSGESGRETPAERYKEAREGLVRSEFGPSSLSRQGQAAGEAQRRGGLSRAGASLLRKTRLPRELRQWRRGGVHQLAYRGGKLTY